MPGTWSKKGHVQCRSQGSVKGHGSVGGLRETITVLETMDLRKVMDSVGAMGLRERPCARAMV